MYASGGLLDSAQTLDSGAAGALEDHAAAELVGTAAGSDHAIDDGVATGIELALLLAGALGAASSLSEPAKSCKS